MPRHPTPKDAVFKNAGATLYRYRSERTKPTVLLVPSMINRWYVLDLRKQASVAAAFVDAGFDTFLLDWGVPQDEDRYLDWDGVIARLDRVVRRTCKFADVDQIGLLGYCMGATVSGIYTALNPDRVSAFCNLAGPFDFTKAGMLGDMVNPEWFDADAVADAGNVQPTQMQSGFVSMRPTSQISKWVGFADKMHDAKYVDAFNALDEWANDNIPFPGEAYRTYIKALYQNNELYNGEHYVAGEHVDLNNVTCPLLTVVASRDTICPDVAAFGLEEKSGSKDTERLVINGGHVGAVVGSRASKDAYPKITEWFAKKLAA